MADPGLDSELPRLKGWDLFPPRLHSLFNGWSAAMRMWKLTDPSAPTYDAGSALGEFLFVPGLHIPSIVFGFFLLGGLGIEEMRSGHFFTATGFPHFATSDHFPAELQIPCEITSASVLLRRSTQLRAYVTPSELGTSPEPT